LKESSKVRLAYIPGIEAILSMAPSYHEDNFFKVANSIDGGEASLKFDIESPVRKVNDTFSGG